MGAVAAAVSKKIIPSAFFKRPCQDLSRPEKFGLSNTTNHRIPLAASEESLGGWLVKPPGGHQWNIDFKDEVAILYLHGNIETRSYGHRLGLYKVFQDIGLITLTVDYRGFGDSSFLFSPTEYTMTEDAIAAFQWLKAGLFLPVHPQTKKRSL